MATYVLVQGGNMSTDTWNKLTKGDPVSTADGHMGATYWDGTAAALRGHDHRVIAPDLADEHCCHLVDHIGQICTVFIENALEDVILVGHSYGGMIITGVADRMPERIRRLVYLDAALPGPGQSLFDIIASGGSDPLSYTGLEPAPPYVEKLQFEPTRIQRLPKTYILCTKSEFAAVTEVARRTISAAGEGWTFIELQSSHVPMADAPEKLYPDFARRRMRR
jgi:pimeloyl-ACP methyl ester carboxylesterase